MQPGPDPYGPRPTDPTAPPPHDPYAPPYGSAPGQPHDPYGPPPAQPYGAPPAAPYGPPPAAPYQDPYGGTPMYPNAGYPFPQGQQNTLGLISMILGIASVPLVCCHLGLPLGVAALVTGWLGKQKADRGLAGNSGQAIAGMVCGAFGAVLGLAWGALAIVGFTLSGP
ncbi:DUF4190 domain-containing protein [Micromonospora thermarum]|uniref:DUF4190 domain-containing protein n=1 Tax=Micromonospora thermarum TaxID=2720024 RepID=UPI00197C4133|nr:DUF4190 domain-containing protein [Micromonospora thermarum]